MYRLQAMPARTRLSYAALQNVASVGLAGRIIALCLFRRLQYAGGIYQQGGRSFRAWAGAWHHKAIKAAGFVNETGHNIADVFMTYFNSTGPVYENGVIVNAPIVNWICGVRLSDHRAVLDHHPRCRTGQADTCSGVPAPNTDFLAAE